MCAAIGVIINDDDDDNIQVLTKCNILITFVLCIADVAVIGWIRDLIGALGTLLEWGNVSDLYVSVISFV